MSIYLSLFVSAVIDLWSVQGLPLALVSDNQD